MVEPRMLIVSREMVSPGAEGFERFLVVIFTARRAVFICGETEVMVPCTMVPFLSSTVTVSLAHFMRNRTSFILVQVGGQLRRSIVYVGYECLKCCRWEDAA